MRISCASRPLRLLPAALPPTRLWLHSLPGVQHDQQRYVRGKIERTAFFRVFAEKKRERAAEATAECQAVRRVLRRVLKPLE
eukprot:scaffold301_cov243-Pinguiococcus_pyrenoidosus.AAC.65